MSTIVYLRCANDHPNAIPIQDRDRAVGTKCKCGAGLVANEPRPRPPRRWG